MRTAASALLMLGLMANLTLAAPNGVAKQSGGRKIVTLDVVNDTPFAVVATINGGLVILLEPGQSYIFSVDVGKGNSFSTVSISAYVESAPSISAFNQMTIQAGKPWTATISSPTNSTLAITFSR